MPDSFNPETIAKLKRFPTAIVTDAIDRLHVRLRNTGFTTGLLACRFPTLPPMVGHAVTVRVRSRLPPMKGQLYFDRTEWWHQIETVPGPRVVVIQDADDPEGHGALVGRVHAHIFSALGCVGAVTNGAVRIAPEIEAIGFQLFSSGLSVSHSYMHVLEFGCPVTVAGLTILPGELLHGDLNGIVTVPGGIDTRLLAEIEKTAADYRGLTDFCRSPDFNLGELETRLARNIPSDNN